MVLQGKTFIYDINSLVILDTIDTVPNLKGDEDKYLYDVTVAYLCTHLFLLVHFQDFAHFPHVWMVAF